MVSGSFGVHASFTMTDEELRQCSLAVNSINQLSPDDTDGRVPPIGFHVHVGEAPSDSRATRRLYEAGLLGNGTLVAHAVFTSEEDIRLLESQGCMVVVVNVQSNMNNGLQLPDLRRFCRLGQRNALANQREYGTAILGVGTDGITYDMLEELRALYFTARLRQGDPDALSGERGWVQMMRKDNAAIASRMISASVGRWVQVGALAPGYKADVTVFEYPNPTPLTVDNLPYHLVFGGVGPAMLRHTIVGGTYVCRDGQLVNVSADSIARSASACAEKVWQRAAEIHD